MAAFETNAAGFGRSTPIASPSIARALARMTTRARVSPALRNDPAPADGPRKAFASLSGRSWTIVVTGPVGYLDMPFLFETLGADAPTAKALPDRGIEAAVKAALKDIGVSAASMVAVDRGLATLAFESGSQAISFAETLGAASRARNARSDQVAMVFKTGMATGEVAEGDPSAAPPLRTALRLSRACSPGSLLISPDTRAQADSRAAAFGEPENAGSARDLLISYRAGPQLAYGCAGARSFGPRGAVVLPRRARHLWSLWRDRLTAWAPQPSQYGRLF